MIFYTAPHTCSVATHIALEEAGAEYSTQRLDFNSSEQRSAQYLKINPKARVPSLGTDRGILTETPAILAFIAQTYPQARLAPLDDPFAFAQIQAFNCYLCATVHVAHAHKIRGKRWVDDPSAIEAMRKKVPQTMAECFQLIETEMFVGPWVMGANYSISDIYLYTVSQWLAGDGVDINDFPKVSAHSLKMAEKPSVIKVRSMQ